MFWKCLEEHQIFPGGLDSKESAWNAGDSSSIPGSGTSLEKEIQTTQIFLPGEFHGPRSLEGYSPWGHRELDTTERLTHITLL